MKEPLDDRRIADLFQSLRDADQQQMPDFDELLRRPGSPRQPSTRRLVLLAGCAAALVIIGIATMFFGTGGTSMQRQRSVTKQDENDPNRSSAKLDFDQLHDAVDDYFETLETPPWGTPTDALLALNLDVSFERE